MIIVIFSRDTERFGKKFKTPVRLPSKEVYCLEKTHFVWKLYKRGSEMFDFPPITFQTDSFSIVSKSIPPGVYAKSILPSCQCVNLFMNVRDNRHITFGSQVFTGQSKFWMYAYAKAVSRPYGYILVHLTNHCPKERHLRTHVLSDEGETRVY